MIPDWKLERYLTGDLPEGEMSEIRELEKTDEVFARRVKMLREDNAAILRKMPFERLAEKMDARDCGAERKNNVIHFGFVKFAAAAALVLAVVSVALFSQREVVPDAGAQAMDVAMAAQDDGTRIKGMDARMEIWKKTGDSAVQMLNLDEARGGDEIQLR